MREYLPSCIKWILIFEISAADFLGNFDESQKSAYLYYECSAFRMTWIVEKTKKLAH